MKKILLICNETKTVLNFRKELILFLKKNGFDVSIVVGDDEFIDKVKTLDIDVYFKKFNNRSKNPFAAVNLYRFLKKTINQVKPDVIFTFQLKPNVFGTLAAKHTNIPVLNMVEGLGDPFIIKSFKDKIVNKIVCSFYKKAFKHSKKVFFLNYDDQEEFLYRKLLKPELTTIISGIGIDVDAYHPHYELNKEKRVIYLSRLLRNKGIIEYCEIAKIVKEKRPDICFDLYGSEVNITKEDLKPYIDNNIIFYGGYSTNAEELIKNSRVMLVTSYREGFPRIILEAMAIGRPVVAFNSVGIKDAVVDGETGYLIKDIDLNKTAETVIKLIDDDAQIIKMGKCARKYCEENLSSNKINQKILDEINSVL